MLSDHPEIAKINSEFDTAFAKKFANAELIVNTVRLVLNVNGISLPPIQNPEQEEEIIFKFDKEGFDDLYLCILLDQDIRGHYDAYAQIVSPDELDSMRDMDISRPPLAYGQLVSQWLRQIRRTN